MANKDMSTSPEGGVIFDEMSVHLHLQLRKKELIRFKDCFQIRSFR